MEILLMFLKVFIVGGIICFSAQLLINFTKITSGRILVLFLLIGVFLRAVGLYQYLVDFAGAGATVPIVGFGYSLAKGVEKAIAEKGALGILTGGLGATSAGICAAVLFGFIFSLISKSKDK